MTIDDNFPEVGHDGQARRSPKLAPGYSALMGPAYTVPHNTGVQTKIQKLRRARGWTNVEAAAMVGVSYGQYLKLQNGERRLTDFYIKALAKAFEVPVYALLEGVGTVPLIGVSDDELAGAVKLSRDLGGAPSPSGSSSATAAIEIRGRLMRGIQTDGWLLYFEDKRELIAERVLDELCVVGTAAGEVYIRTPRAGSAPGRFHLEGEGHPTMFDVELAWAAIVVSLIPGSIAQRMMGGETIETQSATFEPSTPTQFAKKSAKRK